jgi:hypothetical protein
MFDIERIRAVRGDFGAGIVLNECLLRLMHPRKQRIEASTDSERSFAAWKLALFQQSILYRAVILAQGASTAWNASNRLNRLNKEGLKIAAFEPPSSHSHEYKIDAWLLHMDRRNRLGQPW